MRTPLVLLLSLLGFASPALAQAPACTGLCLQQVSCPAGQTTSISGIVYAPNGTDPLPNVTVYVPNAPVDAFAPGVSCPVVGAAPSGSPLVGAVTAADGSFTIGNMPVGTAIPVVIVTGRWRVQTTVNTTSCANTAMPASQTHLPQDHTQGDIPKFAIATGSADQVECVLRKVGIANSEFTDPSGTGRINLYKASGSPGAVASSSTPSATTLTGNLPTLESYDVLMLPCEGGPYAKTSTDLADIIAFANAGGRVYSSHYSYVWMYQNPPFNTVVNWNPQQADPPDGTATVNQTFSDGATLATWLQEVGASTTKGQIAISTLRKDFNAVNSPTKTYLTLNNATYGNPVQQFVFDAPVGSTGNQCGRVLFNEYHVENPPTSPANKIFPAECTTAPITPQEKLLEYSLFELTNDGTAATLTPASQDFGTEPVGFNSPVQTFTWTNNSTFSAAVTLLTTTGDFNLVSNNCSSVPAGASCQISVVFNPTAIGARTGILTVGSSASTLTSSLTGTGIPDLTLNFTSLNFGSIDVGASKTLSVSVTNSAPGSIPLPALLTTGDYTVSSPCGGSVPALATCPINVTFTPTTTGSRPGTLSVNSTLAAYNGQTAALSGNGIDFTLAASPTSGTVIAGYSTSTTLTETPLAGFANPLSVSCSTNAPGSVCAVAITSFTPSSTPTTDQVSITTTSEYTVIGYTGGAGGGADAPKMLFWLIAVGSGLLLCLRRGRTSGLVRWVPIALLMLSSSILLTGCSGKLPAKNSIYTPATGSSGAPPGTGGGYTYTLTVTDGFLVHSATYTLKVTVD